MRPQHETGLRVPQSVFPPTVANAHLPRVDPRSRAARSVIAGVLTRPDNPLQDPHSRNRRTHSRMKAIVIHEFGPPDVLSYETVADPVPREGEIRIRIHAATVNRVLDVSLRAGKESARGATLPLIPGVDCAGIVDAVGPGVTKWRKGMRVAAAGMMPLDACAEDNDGYAGPTGMMGIKRPGGFAELICVPACAAIELPAGLEAGETVLVMGAGGNLGSIGIQIAKNVIGAKVIAAAGSDDRVKMGLDLGADHAINYNTHDLQAEVLKIT